MACSNYGAPQGIPRGMGDYMRTSGGQINCIWLFHENDRCHSGGDDIRALSWGITTGRTEIEEGSEIAAVLEQD